MQVEKNSKWFAVLVWGAWLVLVLAPGTLLAKDPGGVTTGVVTGLGGKCLDVFMEDTTDGTPVVLYQCNGGANQTWTFDSVGIDFRLRGIGDKCLRPGSVGGTGFVETEIGPCVGTDTLWRPSAADTTGRFRIEHVDTGQCLDVFNNDPSNGNPITIFQCTGAANQLWSFAGDPGSGNCLPTATRMCLNEGRFAVDVDWVKPNGEPGVGRVVAAGTDDSGLFYFFNPTNWEMLVKVLDNCDGPTNRFWVFAAASTTVQYNLTVTDTETGQVRSYFNPQGNRAAAIADTSAFATCP